ncbi:hypothetical protein BDN71DRAFT_1451334, partial [Pleurotus eryngii]
KSFAQPLLDFDFYSAPQRFRQKAPPTRTRTRRRLVIGYKMTRPFADILASS